MMTTREIIALARKHVVFTELEHNGSARFCLELAVKQFDLGEYEIARMYAKRSVLYSVGIFHPDYVRASK